jgi:hypothetical protein
MPYFFATCVPPAPQVRYTPRQPIQSPCDSAEHPPVKSAQPILLRPGTDVKQTPQIRHRAAQMPARRVDRRTKWIEYREAAAQFGAKPQAMWRSLAMVKLAGDSSIHNHYARTESLVCDSTPKNWWAQKNAVPLLVGPGLRGDGGPRRTLKGTARGAILAAAGCCRQNTKATTANWGGTIVAISSVY